MRKLIEITLIFFKTLDKKYLKNFYSLAFLSIISVFTELVSLLLLSIFIDNISETGTSKPYLNFISTGSILTENILIFLIFFFLLKFIISYILITYQNLTTSRLVETISSQMFNKILSNPYSEFIKSNVSLHIKNLTVEIAQYSLCFQSFLSIISDGIISISIFIFIFILNPIESIISFSSLLLISIVYLIFVKGKVAMLGKMRVEVDEKIFNLYTDSLNSVIEIKTYNTFNLFSNKLGGLLEKRKLYSSNQLTISQIPKLLYEFIIVFIFIILFYYYNFYYTNITLKIGSLTIFLFASLRLLPSFNKLLTALQQLIYYKDAITLINKETHSKNNKVKKPVTEFKEIKLDSIHFSFNENKAINDLSFDIIKNQFIGFIGKSGSGKTTILNILSGLLDISDGKIFIDNNDMTNNFYFPSFGFVSQKTNLFEGSLKNNICLDLEYNKEKFNHCLELSGLNYEDFNEKRVVLEGGKNLSGGQLQRIAISRALYRNPDILFLDEPTSALDDENQTQILNTLNNLKGKTTIIIVTHDPLELEYCDQVININ